MSGRAGAISLAKRGWTGATCVPGELERPERDDPLEEVEQGITGVRVREVGNGRRAWPGDDRGEEDADEESALDAVQHEEHGENAVR